MAWKSRGVEPASKSVASRKWALLLCIGSFCVGMLFSDRIWIVPEVKGISRTTKIEEEKLNLVSEGCDSTTKDVKCDSKNILGEVSKTHNAIQFVCLRLGRINYSLRKVQDEPFWSGQ